jgi:hypothetical protein
MPRCPRVSGMRENPRKKRKTKTKDEKKMTG